MSLAILPIKGSGDEQKLKQPIHPNLPNIATGQLGLMISPVKTGKSTKMSPAFCRDRCRRTPIGVIRYGVGLHCVQPEPYGEFDTYCRSTGD